jgi:acetyltransferase-like isoleucine patch superfamily enzyme
MKLKSINRIIKKIYKNLKLRNEIKLLGKRVNIHYSAQLHYPGNIEIHDFVHIGPNVYINAKGKITIKKGVIIAPNVRILTSNHNYEGEIKSVPYDNIDNTYHCIISEGAWICDSSIILPGVKIGKGAIVGAGSVVTKDVEDYTVVAGNPAKVIKYRDRSMIEKLIQNNQYYLAQGYDYKENIFHE